MGVHASAVTERPASLSRTRPPAWSDNPNTNPALGTVGPNVADPGDIPADLLQSQPWSGWPDSYATPFYESGTDNWTGFGYGRHSPDGYMGRVSVVGTCVDLNTRQLASFPVYGVKNSRPVRLPSWADNPEPELYADWSEFMKTATNSLQLAGEIILYATARFADGFPSRFVTLNPSRVDIEQDDGRIVYSIDGDPLPAGDVCHIKYEAVPGRLRGISPLGWVGRNLVSASALESYATDIARHGVPAVLSNPANLSSTQREDAKNNWMAARLGRPGAPAVLSGQWTYETVSLSPTDMALVDLKVFDEQRIASAFGVPPYLVGLPQADGPTYSNATSLFDFHWRATLRPMASSIAAALSSWALPHGTRLEFNRDEYVRPDLASRAQAYSILHSIEDSEGRAAMTVDEVRTSERFPPYEEIAITDTEALTGSL